MFENEARLLHQAVERAGRVLITATEREDADSVAAELAVQYIIRHAFPRQPEVVDIVNERSCPERYLFLPGAETIRPAGWLEGREYDLGIVVDCGAERSGLVREHFFRCPCRVKIDHHAFGNAGGYHIELSSVQAASTTEILFHLAVHPVWAVPLDPKLAQMIYAGMIADTGAFQYDLTKPSTHRIAARLLETGFDFPATAERINLQRSFAMKKLLGLVLGRLQRAGHGLYAWSVLTREMVEAAGASSSDAGDIIDELCFIRGIEVSLLFVEQDRQSVRISLRSKGGINVGDFARRLTPSGGGHPRAAGCTLPGNLESVVARVTGELDLLAPP